ncbi:MAG: ATP-dependent Clp protease ATP-binding subunit, partial [Bacteroidales bacterium]|nr:ATP-dependent Clp protease ATP-binding subunit [Bacteroidales bacterium]
QGITIMEIVSAISVEIKREEKSNQAEQKSSTPMLNSFGYDMTKAAVSGKLDPVIGREKEIERLAQILGRRKKNNPILIGESGVGKSAIAEGLAIRIAQKRASRALLDKKIISLDLGSVVAGTKYRGQFEERIKSILKEIKANPNIILFIDELHTLVGAGSAQGSLDAASLLKPALARGEIQCIGATTPDEYRETIEKDGALERRFQKIMVEPTNYDQTLAILEGIREKYESYHNVKYSDAAIKACINLSTRYISNRCLPDKAIDVMDEAGSRVHISNMKVPGELIQMEEEIEPVRIKKREAVLAGDFKSASELHELEKYKVKMIESVRMDLTELENPTEYLVDEEDIANVVSLMSNVPVYKIAETESIKLMKMADVLKTQVIGQDEAISKVVKAIRRNRAGLKDPNKPIGTFLFLGPTGVGKTQLAKKIAEYMFDSPDNIVRIDMSEYNEKFTVSRLIGAPPGYVGYDEGGQLSEQIRRKPYSVVLLDEVEKAHPEIFNILLQVLDEGRLTDSNGRYIDFRNTIMILTSNIGSREMKDFGGGVGFAVSSAELNRNNKSIINRALSKVFSPEFLNRLDDQIYFNTLSKEDIYKIIDIELKDLLLRINQMDYTLTISVAAKKFIAEVGYDPKFGARPLKRAIQKYVEDPVSEAIIENTTFGKQLQLVMNEDKNDTVVIKKGRDLQGDIDIAVNHSID